MTGFDGFTHISFNEIVMVRLKIYIAYDHLHRFGLRVMYMTASSPAMAGTLCDESPTSWIALPPS